LEDTHQREVNYLRVSITDRCNLACLYCGPRHGWEKLPPGEILRYEEILHLARVGAGIGLHKVRVTGGEPLVRRGVVDFIRRLHQVPGVREVCLTTNGVLLPNLAEPLFDTGLRHLNLSLDTLRRERYFKLTGQDNFKEVWAGLERAAVLGFSPLKINCVVMKEINDDELLDFATLARDYPFQVRFIELMPTVSRELWDRHFLPMAEVHRRLKGLGLAREVPRSTAAGPARPFRVPGFKGELGFISPISEHQCRTCNRLRLTAAGGLRACLFASTELDLKGPLRQGLDDEALGRLFKEAILLKASGPRFDSPKTPLACRPMVSIGG
jgi:cyclic pyranopterin phosphate synthase